MPNLNGGRYDAARNRWPPYREPGMSRKAMDAVIVYLTVGALLAGLALFVFWTNSKREADHYRDGYDRSDRNNQIHKN